MLEVKIYGNFTTACEINPFIAETILGGNRPKAFPTGLARTCYAAKAVYSVACLEWGKWIGDRRSAGRPTGTRHRSMKLVLQKRLRAAEAVKESF